MVETGKAISHEMLLYMMKEEVKMSNSINLQRSNVVKGATGFSPVMVLSAIENVISSIMNYFEEVENTRRIKDQLDYEIRKGEVIVKEFKIRLDAELTEIRLIFQDRDSQRKAELFMIKEQATILRTLIRNYTQLVNNKDTDPEITKPILELIVKSFATISELSLSGKADSNK